MNHPQENSPLAQLSVSTRSSPVGSKPSAPAAGDNGEKLRNDDTHAADDGFIAIIVNSENTQAISKQQLRDIYMDRLSSWRNGKDIMVYNLPLASAGRELFSRKVLQMSVLDAATQASNRSITNRQSNRVQTRQQNVVAHYVANNPQAIGYVALDLARRQHNLRILFTLNQSSLDRPLP